MQSACTFARKSFDRVSQHYGLVGLPESAGAPTEGNIQSLLGQSSPYVTTDSGSRFRIVTDGLVQPLTEQLLWEVMRRGPLLFSPGKYGAFGPDPQADFVLFEGSWTGNDEQNPNFSAVLGGFRWHLRLANSDPSCGATVQSWGLCNSRLVQYGNTADPNFCDENAPLAFPGSSHPHLWNILEGVFYYDTLLPAMKEVVVNHVWRAPISVIADIESGSSPCGAGFVVDAGKSWRTIGFLDMVFFDADIGRPPPQPPSNPCDFSDARSPWGFTRGYSASLGCNVLRGRTPCEPAFVPSIHYRQLGRARLVGE